jgi:hypothetical protein
MRIFTQTLFVLIFIAIAALPSHAQSANDPVAYMSKFTESQKQINYEMLGYVSAVAHNKSAKKVAKQRSELITAISQAKAKAAHMTDFEGDSNLRVATLNYFTISYIVAKEDYGKIMDLEEIAEESYDNMEAYLKAQEVANDKEQEAFDKADKELRAFAANHHISIKDEDSKDARMTETVNKINKYYNKVYLTFFKCGSNENYMIKALEKKDVNGIEQNKNALLKNSTDNLPKLDEIGSFEGDASLITVCKSLLQFYKKEATDKMPILTDYLVKNDNFQKMKAEMDKKSASSRTQEDVDKFNAAVKDINDAVNTYNKTNNELNQTRTKLINDLNNAVETFMSKHIPRHK